MNEKTSILAKQLLSQLIDYFIILENDLEQIKKELELYKNTKVVDNSKPKTKVNEVSIIKKEEPKTEMQMTSQEIHEEEQELPEMKIPEEPEQTGMLF